ncbi:hypothetical protein GQ457_04G035220 [Hibiscus cannabinus]
MHFADMLHADGSWNTSRLSALLDPIVVPYVIGVPPPSLDDTSDMVAWRCTPTGVFTVASAYECLLNASWDACEPKWACIWSLPVTQRIRMFLWLVLRQRLLTNGERVRRGISSNPSCSCCGCYNESILHILRDCPPTTPPHDWVSLNTDAAVSSSSNFGAIGGVLCGSTGDWLCGYCKSVGVVSPLNAELWSILEGLNLAWTRGFPRVQVQSDCSAAIRLILDPTAASSSSGLVRRISAWQNRPWSLRFLWVPRETNMVADGLSKLPSMNDFQLKILDNISDSIRPMLVRDRDGPPYHRKC